METKLENTAKQTFSMWDPPILSYEWWKQSDELWKLQIQTAPNYSKK